MRGGNPYRAKAYSRAADSLAALALPLDDLIEENRLTEIPRVGDAIADIITKLHRNGTHPSLEPADRVVNAMPLAEIMRYLRQKRRSFARAAANLALFGTGSSGNMSEPGTGVA